MTDREVMQQALDALNLPSLKTQQMLRQRDETIATLRAQLEQPEPYDQTALELCEVCCWETLIPGHGCLNCELMAQTQPQRAGPRHRNWAPPHTLLYTTPPQQQAEPMHGDIRALRYRIFEIEGELLGYKRMLDVAEAPPKRTPLEKSHD